MNLARSLIAAALLAGAAACGGGNGDAGNGANGNQAAQASGNQAAAGNAGQDRLSQEDRQAIERARALAREQGSEEERKQGRDEARSEMEGLRFVVDHSDRKLRIYRGDEEIRSHDVAIGTEENPTPTGDYAFHRVDLNPRWVPPDSDWAEDREPKAPGAPDNPMGRARLVYQMPYTIHGTDQLDSLGKAVSHGSIRVANEHVVDLAEMLLKAGGAWEGQQWFQRMTENRDEEYQIPLEQDVPLKLQE